MKSVPPYSHSLVPITTSSSSNLKPTQENTSVASENEDYSSASAASDQNVEIKCNEFRSSEWEEVDQIGTAGSVKSSNRKGSRKIKQIQNKSDKKRSKNSLKPKKTTQRKSTSGANTIQKGQVSKKNNVAKLTKSLIMEPTSPAQSDQRVTTSSSSLPTARIMLNNSSSYRQSSWNISKKLTEDFDQSEEENLDDVGQSLSEISTSDYVSCLSDLIARILQDSKCSLKDRATRTKEQPNIIGAKSNEQSNVCDTDLHELPRSCSSRSSATSCIITEVIQRTSKEIPDKPKMWNMTSTYTQDCFNSFLAEEELSNFPLASKSNSLTNESDSQIVVEKILSNDQQRSPSRMSSHGSSQCSLDIPLLLNSTVLADIVDEVIEKTSAELMADVKISSIPNQDVIDDEIVREIVTDVLCSVLSDVNMELSKSGSSVVDCHVSDTAILKQRKVDTRTKEASTHTQSATSKLDTKSENTVKRKSVKKRISQALENVAMKLAKKNLMKACIQWIKEKTSRCCCCCPRFRNCRSNRMNETEEETVDVIEGSSSDGGWTSSGSSVTILEKRTPASRLTPSNLTLSSSTSSDSSPETKRSKPKFRRKKKSNPGT